MQNRIIETRERLAFSQAQMARYLGVPITTLRNWERDNRVPSASVIRLLDVLGTIEVMAPDIHTALIPAAPPRARRGRV